MVPQDAVIVWQLRGFIENVECFLVSRASAFSLVIERAGERLAEERYLSLHDTMARARELKANLLQVGFKAVSKGEPEPVLDSLLLHFVRVGTAVLHATPGS